MWAIKRRSGAFSGCTPWVLATSAIALLFMIPKMIDWTKGSQSNLFAILAHMHDAH
jgi:hypothetical protein